MDKTINQIIIDEDITTLYQPIVNLITGEIMGYEALSRGPEWSRMFSPVELIKEAELHGLAYELEFLMRKKAIGNLTAMEPNQKLFVNINPHFMRNESVGYGRTQEMLKSKNLSPSNIVFELTERSMISDYKAFNEILNHYKNQNYKIAIDDVGAGYSGLRTIRETTPNYIKIDMELIRNIDQDTIKEALIVAILNFSLTTNIQLIAEGIETENELIKLIEMGVHYGQGYFLQRPSKSLSKIRNEVVEIIHLHNSMHRDLNLFNDSKNMIGSIVISSSYVNGYMSCENVKNFFEESGSEGICVIENNKPIGIIMRENLLLILSSRYGHSLYANKKISYIMDTNFLMVDYHESISKVSSKAMSRERNKTYDIIVVAKKGDFFGTISINSLLRTLINVETQMAKELNPLTLLPGNVVIHRVLNDLILYSPICAVVYLDFDSFKPYNDLYGFESGDRMLKKVGELILQNVKDVAPIGSFVGHIGGDDFIFVIEETMSNISKVCRKIVAEFETIKEEFYTQEDFSNGYIISKDRDNCVRKFDLLTISIAAVFGELSRFENVNELSKYMGQLKKEAKEIRGNAIVLRDLLNEELQEGKLIKNS